MSEIGATCDYCLGPIRGAGLSGRKWPDRPAGRYCCFGCLSLGEQRPTTKVPFSQRFNGLALRIALAILVSGQSMIVSLGIAMEPSTSREDKLLVYGGILAGTLIVFGLLGIPLVRSAWGELKAGYITLESLFLLTMAGAFAASMQSFITGTGPVYFEVVSVILVVYSLGKAIMARARQSAIGGTQAWADSLATCHRMINGSICETPVTEIVPGDLAEVRPGELFPVDGMIERGTGFVSMAAMTGEPFAVVKRPGNPVLAGCVSHDALFLVRASVPGTARQVDHLFEAVESARAIPSAGQAVVDRISARVFPLLLLLSALTFAYWTLKADVQTGVFNAMSVLLVACPCALGLATPLVIWVTLAKLAEWGFVVRAGDVVERLADIDTVVFDKTGTLTEDRFTLADISLREDPGHDRPRWPGWIAAVQSRSSHPMAGAFADLVFGNPEPVEVTMVRTVPGCGIEATIQTDRPHEIRIGRPDWIAAPADEAELLDHELIEGEGHRIDCEADGQLVAIAIVRERLRESVPHACEHLAELGIPVSVLTGDTAARATITGVADVRAGLLPDDKTTLVRAWRDQGRHVLMVGDGSNDAGALAAASVGIALASGTDLATRAADASLYHVDLRVIPWAVALARQARLVIRRNLFVAAIYNLLGVTLAALGILHPIVAAFLMVFSSLFVIWSSSRVNVPAEWECHDTPAVPVPRSKTICHALALILQGLLVAWFFNITQGRRVDATVFGFALVGVISAIIWARWKKISHEADMAYGMLTTGNLGMIIGWIADAGFVRLTQGDCGCAEAIFRGVLKPWMWVGMWIGGTIGMLALGRTPHGGSLHRWSMLTGGNLGMGVGMLAGGWLASRIPAHSISDGAAIGLAGMTVGMLVGMFAGTALTEQSVLRFWRIRRKLRANP